MDDASPSVTWSSCAEVGGTGSHVLSCWVVGNAQSGSINMSSTSFRARADVRTAPHQIDRGGVSSIKTEIGGGPLDHWWLGNLGRSCSDKSASNRDEK